MAVVFNWFLNKQDLKDESWQIQLEMHGSEKNLNKLKYDYIFQCLNFLPKGFWLLNTKSRHTELFTSRIYF